MVMYGGQQGQGSLEGSWRALSRLVGSEPQTLGWPGGGGGEWEVETEADGGCEKGDAGNFWRNGPALGHPESATGHPNWT